MGFFFLQKERIFPGVHEIDAPISSPRIADKHFTDTRIFLIFVGPELHVLFFVFTPVTLSSKLLHAPLLFWNYSFEDLILSRIDFPDLNTSNRSLLCKDYTYNYTFQSIGNSSCTILFDNHYTHESSYTGDYSYSFQGSFVCQCSIGKFLEVLWEVLQGVLWEIRVLRGCSCSVNWGWSRGCSRGCSSLDHPQFPSAISLRLSGAPPGAP